MNNGMKFRGLHALPAILTSLAIIGLLVAAPAVLREITSAIADRGPKTGTVISLGVLCHLVFVLLGAALAIGGYARLRPRLHFDWPLLVLQGIPALILSMPSTLAAIMELRLPWEKAFGTNGVHTPAMAGVWLGAVLASSFLVERKESVRAVEAVTRHLLLALTFVLAVYLHHQVWVYVLRNYSFVHSVSPADTGFLIPANMLFGMLLSYAIRAAKDPARTGYGLHFLIQGVPALLLALPAGWYALLGMPGGLVEWLAQTSRAPFPVATVAGVWAGKVLMDFLLVSLGNRRLSRGQRHGLQSIV